MQYEKLDLTEIEELYTDKKICFGEWLKILSIPTLLVVVVLLGFFKIIAFKVESHTLILISIIYIIYLFFIKHNASIAVCKFETNFDILKLRIKEYLNDRIFKASNQLKSLASMDDFFENYKKRLRNDNFSSIASSIFPTLGILGTFISIALSMPDFSANETTAFEKEITILLGGIATAFYVSIYGIFLSIWWIFFEKSGISGFEEDIKELKKICNKYTWQEDELEMAKFEEEQNRHLELVNAVSKFGEDNFIKEFDRALKNRMLLFQELMEDERKIFKEVGDGLREAHQSHNINIKLHQNLLEEEKSISKNINNIALLLTNSVDLLSTLIDKLDKKERDLYQPIDSLHSSVKILDSNIKLENRKLAEQKERVGREIEALKALIMKYNENLTAQNRELLSTFEELNSHINNSSKSFIKAFETPAVENIRHIYSMLLKEFEELGEKIERIPKDFEKSIQKFDNNLDEKLRNSLELIDGELATIVTRLASLLKDIDESAKKISNALERR